MPTSQSALTTFFFCIFFLYIFDIYLGNFFLSDFYFLELLQLLQLLFEHVLQLFAALPPLRLHHCWSCMAEDLP